MTIDPADPWTWPVDRGAWVAFHEDGSGFVIFETEIQAYRYAAPYYMKVKFARYGDEDWMHRSDDLDDDTQQAEG